jgi:acyl carrier protein phosphodiesterase
VNFLAHCLLAARAADHHDDELVAGGILGDFWKGKVPELWTTGLQTGVRLHRRIDAVSNRHAGIRRSCERFPSSLRRYAPILVDIHADLVLADRWSAHCTLPLQVFADACYSSTSTLHAVPGGVSEDTLRFVRYLRERDLLNLYGTWEGVGLCIRGIARRLNDGGFADSALEACQDLHGSLAEDFDGYFPDLLNEARQFVKGAPTTAPLLPATSVKAGR